MSECLKSKKVTLRKPRRCTGCLDRFEIGEQMHYWVGLVDGDFSTSYYCGWCENYFAQHRDLDSIMEGDLQEEKREWERKQSGLMPSDFNCPPPHSKGDWIGGQTP